MHNKLSTFIKKKLAKERNKSKKKAEKTYQHRSDRFGGKTITIGECNERITDFDGIRIQRLDNQETGTIKMVLINREHELVQIWVTMDGRYTQCIRPSNIKFLDNQLESSRLLKEAKK